MEGDQNTEGGILTWSARDWWHPAQPAHIRPQQGDWRTVQSLEDRASAVTQKRVKLRESDTGDMYNIFLILSQR